jgi:hypothetical protein
VGPHWGRRLAASTRQQGTVGDNERRGQRPFRSDWPGTGNRWSALSHGSMPASSLPCPAGPIGPWSRRTGAPGASATVRDRTPRSARGPWADWEPQGHDRPPTVTRGEENPRVDWPPGRPARITPGSESDCGPEGRRFESTLSKPHVHSLARYSAQGHRIQLTRSGAPENAKVRYEARLVWGTVVDQSPPGRFGQGR